MNAVSEQPTVRIERTLPASPHDVYRAWLEPDLIRLWMAPGYEVPRVEVEEHIGGRYRVWHSDAGIPVGGFESEILELVPDERIVWLWGFTGPDRNNGPTYDSRLTITVQQAPSGTLLTLVHERLEELAAALPEVAAKVGPGWNGVITKLATLLTEAA